MKLLILTPVYYPYRGGTATVAEQNAHMARDAGNTVHVLTPRYASMQNRSDFEERDGITIKRMRPFFSFGNSACIAVPFTDLKEVDCIHVHYPFISGIEFSLFFARFFFKKKIIITYHMDLIADGLVRKVLFFLYSTCIFPILFFTAHTIMVTSLDYAKNCRIRRLLHFFLKKLIELPNSVPQKAFEKYQNDPTLLEQYGIQQEKKVILFVGSLDRAHYFKGVTVLLKSMKELLGKVQQKIVFVIVGGGDLLSSYQKYAHSLGIQNNVIFTGSIPEVDRDILYGRATCVVLPSTTPSEAFGVVLVEGMAHGTLGIASNLPGVRSVIQDGVNGFLVKPGDSTDLAKKIALLLEDEELAREMGQRGRELVEEKYSYNVVKKKYLSLL